jgi:hypothetical protein
MESENTMKTDLKSHIGIAMSLDQVVKILDKQLANDYVLFTKTLNSRLGSCCNSLLGGDHYD